LFFYVLLRSNPATKYSNPDHKITNGKKKKKLNQIPTGRMKNKELNSIIKPKSTQIHHNHPELSTQSSCPNLSNLRENPNSQIQHKLIAEHHQIHYKPWRKPNPINLSQNHQQT